MRLVFPYLAQAHQVLHSLPIAAAIAQRHRDVEVHVAAISDAQLDFARRLVARHAPDATIRFDRLPLGPGDAARLAAGLGRSHFKQYTLLRNRRYFNGFDAVVTPERTSLFLRRIGVRTPLIWTRHGAGDREIGFADDVRAFDFVLMAGRKIEQRLLAGELIRPGAYVSGVYAKFDWAQGAGERWFDNDRPTVLYNPHFRPARPRRQRGAKVRVVQHGPITTWCSHRTCGSMTRRGPRTTPRLHATEAWRTCGSIWAASAAST